MEWSFERHAEAVDDHVRFLAKWDGKVRQVFVSAKLIDQQAGRMLSRIEAADWVEDHVTMLVGAAARIEREHSPGRTVITIDRAEDLPG